MESSKDAGGTASVGRLTLNAKHATSADAGVPVVATFAFVDLAGFTALTDVHGDEHAAELATSFLTRAVRACVGSTRVVKGLGDAVMLVADNAGDAVPSVLALARDCAAEELHPEVRAGLHHGPAVQVGDDFFGRTVNVAARIAASAGVGQLRASAELSADLHAHGLAPRALPPQQLRHVLEPMLLVEAAVDPDDSGSAVDPVCRMRVEPAAAAAWLRDGDRLLWFCSQECLTRFVTAQRT